MHTSDAGRTFIARHEGLRLRAYDDGAGVLTLGFGHTTAAGPPVVRRGMTITHAEADDILAADLRKFERHVDDLAKGVVLAQHEFDALVSLTFNIGPGGFGGSTALRQLRAGKRQSAANAMLLWSRVKGRIWPGLLTRRREERRLFLTGDYGAPLPHEHRPQGSGSVG